MSQSSGDGSSGDNVPPKDFAKFEPIDCNNSPPPGQLAQELHGWLDVIKSQCTYPSEVFHEVMLNLVKNPNITSSHLFRADVFYDSGENAAPGSNDLVNQLKAEYRPIDAILPSYDLNRTIVRQLIPRNPQLDKPLIQTCHFFRALVEDEERSLVLYIPHVQQAEDMPFYHPAVAKLAFLHRWRQANDAPPKPHAPGSVSVSYGLFPNTILDTKLERTALRLLQTVHKHGQGQLAGYEKRVHLDQIIPQKRYQDTYTRMKGKYGKQLSDQWVEVTDPGKHVFEDIGIAAFLVELWRDMYSLPSEDAGQGIGVPSERPAFSGFVDIGCGNGLLVYILISEGYPGWGFDARQRKTWSTFPVHIQRQLKQQLLVPDIFLTTSPASSGENELYHNGIFDPGTFIVSNHADELTPWTPLLAYLNQSAFIAVPCCSHDLSGARFRAPSTTKTRQAATRLPQQRSPIMSSTSAGNSEQLQQVKTAWQAAETGSLKRTDAQKKMPSAYATLCSYVTSLAEEVGFEGEHDVLRIPSTRNQCLIGRWRRSPAVGDGKLGDHCRRDAVIGIVERELGRAIDVVGREWIDRAEKLAKKPGSGH